MRRGGMVYRPRRSVVLTIFYPIDEALRACSTAHFTVDRPLSPDFPPVYPAPAMYQPSHFREDRADVLHAMIHAHPLATVVTAGAGGLMANPIPMILGPGGTLHGHLA